MTYLLISLVLVAAAVVVLAVEVARIRRDVREGDVDDIGGQP